MVSQVGPDQLAKHVHAPPSHRPLPEQPCVGIGVGGRAGAEIGVRIVAKVEVEVGVGAEVGLTGRACKQPSTATSHSGPVHPASHVQ